LVPKLKSAHLYVGAATLSQLVNHHVATRLTGCGDISVVCLQSATYASEHIQFPGSIKAALEVVEFDRHDCRCSICWRDHPLPIASSGRGRLDRGKQP